MAGGYGYGGPGDEQRLPSVVPLMREDAVTQLVVHLLRNPAVIGNALSTIKAEHFTREPEYRLLWGAIVAKNAEYGLGVVPYTALYLDVLDRIEYGAEALTSEQQDRLIGIPKLVDAGQAARVGVLHHAYHTATADEMNPQLGSDLLRRFLEERAIAEDIRRKFATAGTMVPDDIHEFTVDMMSRLSVIRAIGHSVELDPSDEELLSKPVDVRPTGVSFLDAILDGGHAADETYVLYGPEKGGKTQLALQLMASTGWVAHKAAEAGQEPRWAYYFTYEEPSATLLRRLYCYGARILRERIEYKLFGRETYSRTGELQPYELEMYCDMGEDLARPDDLPGEWERLLAWKRSAGKYVRFFDMTRRENPAMGGGGIHEIVATLRQQLARGRRPGVVIIDYINTCVGNEVAAKGKKHDDTRHMAKALVYEAGSFVASPFECPVWLLNQYDANANKRGPATVLSSADGAEVKTLGAACNFSLCLGVRDRETQVAQFLVDRARRSKSQGRILQLRFDGDFGRWADVSGQFDANAATGAITPKAQGAVAAGMSAAARARMSRPAPAPVDPFLLEKAYGEDGVDATDESLF